MRTVSQFHNFSTKTYRCHTYQHIDDDVAFQQLEVVLRADYGQPPTEIAVNKMRTLLSAFFVHHGWQGDGEITCIAIPPCFYLNPRGETFCKFVFHVKQSDDGVSFLAIPKGLRLGIPKNS